jgi:hypothetical protein
MARGLLGALPGHPDRPTHPTDHPPRGATTCEC